MQFVLLIVERKLMNAIAFYYVCISIRKLKNADVFVYQATCIVVEESPSFYTYTYMYLQITGSSAIVAIRLLKLST